MVDLYIRTEACDIIRLSQLVTIVPWVDGYSMWEVLDSDLAGWLVERLSTSRRVCAHLQQRRASWSIHAGKPNLHFREFNQ